ncbi:hypothetical protein A2331_00980 [Candidatus Falkowbacteria bacterium RIFOXYB2_FULL_34_18]|nr:MAG: hypothetical protein A2331_00980 [Candidatus Falkowbacteria bacterium RIFOXYB2_FULL_34_18]
MLNSEKFIKYLIYGLAFFLPLFFLPVFNSLAGVDNFHKNFLLFATVPWVFVLWLLLKNNGKKFKLEINILDFFILVFLFFSFISTIFGIDRFSSFWGAYGYFGASFTSMLTMVLFYFLISRELKEGGVEKILKIVISSFGLIIIFFIFILYGISKYLVEWFEFSQGSFEDFSILIVFFNILLLAIFICGKNKQMFKKYPQMFLMKSLLVVSFLFLIFINFLPAWWCFSFGLILILIFDFITRGFGLRSETTQEIEQKEKELKKAKKIFFNFRIFFKNNSYKILILSLFFVSCVFIFFNFYNLNGYSTKERVSQKLQLDIGNTLDIAKKMRGRDLFLGVGLENFKYIFSDLRNAEMNNSPFWHIRFNKTASHILNLFISLGIFGLLSYLFIFTFWIYAAVKFLRNKKNNNIFLFFITGIPFLVLFLGQFVYSVNINLLFLFWLFFGLNVGQLKIKNYELRLPRASEKVKNAIIKIIILISFFAWFVLLGYAVKYYAADIYFQMHTEDSMNRAIILNTYRYNYPADLAKYHAGIALREFKKEDNKRDLELAGGHFKKSIFFAGRAIELAPYYVVPYETLAMIYRQIGEYSYSYQELAIQMFKKASELEPSNPVLALELGKLLINNNPEEAILILEKAKGLKSNYLEAEFNLAKSYIGAGQEKEALMILEELSENNSRADIYYELGRAYYNLGDFRGAINSFRQVITVSPIHANALYGLGLSFEQTGEKQEALYFFKKVSALNPDNKELKEKIKELEEN